MTDKLINQEDYVNEQGQFEATHYFRDLHMKMVEQMDPEEIKKSESLKETVTLFHGTTTAHLNNILQNGLLPRKETQNNNWKEIRSSAPNVVYLTNKWHYFYAYEATNSYLKDKAEKEGKEPEPWFISWESLPCYIECEVPKALLVTDEDFFHSRYVSDKIKSALKKQKPLSLDWQECLAHYATAGVLGGITKEYIKSFSILGEVELFKELMLSNSKYQKDLQKWGTGKGKGDLKLLDIQKREDASLKNGMWFMHQVPKGATIGQIGVNPKSDTLALVFQTPKTDDETVK